MMMASMSQWKTPLPTDPINDLEVAPEAIKSTSVVSRATRSSAMAVQDDEESRTPKIQQTTSILRLEVVILREADVVADVVADVMVDVVADVVVDVVADAVADVAEDEVAQEAGRNVQEEAGVRPQGVAHEASTPGSHFGHLLLTPQGVNLRSYLHYLFVIQSIRHWQAYCGPSEL